jgi:hypothetical protein
VPRRLCPASLCLVAACLALAGTPRPAAAQSPSAERAYVSASLFGDIKRFSGDPAESIFDGEALGVGIMLGASVHPRWDLQFGADLPRFTATSRERVVTLQKRSFPLHSITRNRVLSVATLARLRGARLGRVRLGYLAGMSFVRLRRDTHTVAPAGTPAGLIPKPDTAVEYSAAPTIGLDARVSVSRHLAIVPALHAAVFRLTAGSGLLIRPRLGISWTF